MNLFDDLKNNTIKGNVENHIYFPQIKKNCLKIKEYHYTDMVMVIGNIYQ